MRQELLAQARLKQHKGQRLKLPLGEDVKSKNQSIVDLQLAATTEITWKHAQEREVTFHKQMMDERFSFFCENWTNVTILTTF